MTRNTLDRLTRKVLSKLDGNTFKSIKHQSCLPTSKMTINKEYNSRMNNHNHSTIVCKNKTKKNKQN